MRFAFTSEQEMIAETARQFFATEATSARTRAAIAMPEGIDRALWTAFAIELGLAGVGLPDHVGGSGLGLVELAIVAEAAGYRLAAVPLLASLGMAAPAVLAGGTAAQQTRWLPDIARGSAVATVAEVRQGIVRGHRLTGIAPLVPHGACADVLLASIGDGMWIVDLRAPGVTLVAQTSMDQTRPLARILLDNAAGDPLADVAAARRAMERSGWTMIAADALGGAQACLDLGVAHATQRLQFGRPIGSFQAVKHALADTAIAIEQARSAVYWAAAADEGSPDAWLAAHAAKATAARAYADAAAALIQLHGGIGFTWEHDAHLYFKRAQADRTWLGTPEWHFDRIAEIMQLTDAA